MKSALSLIGFSLVCSVCAAGEATSSSIGNRFEIERLPFGSGTPAAAATIGTETANHVADGLYHIPNYLPGFPTAATIWPREVPVQCVQDAVTWEPVCTGYEVIPAIGRGEYIFVRPIAKAAPPPPPTAVPVVEPEPPKPLPVTRKKPLG